MKHITRTIWLLSLVSLFTDMASEMLYPVLPAYLKGIGFSVALIGVLEGMAEATAGLSKGYFGNWSDRSGSRLPFVQVGYGLSAVSKPLMAVFVYPLWVFFARTLDRLGKGVRTGARDALLSAGSAVHAKGRVFGFHRSMDTLGAVLGPLLALLYLHWHPGAYRTLFFVAFIPGMLAIACTALIRERRLAPAAGKKRPGWADFFRYWRAGRPEYRRLVSALLVFALFNSSDIFLLLQAKAGGRSDAEVIGIYIYYNLVFALAAFPLGIAADRIGMRRMLAIGLLFFAAVYAGMAFLNSAVAMFSLFFLYGLYAAATDGVAKAWISNTCEKQHTATAIGTYTALQSVCALLASSLTGAIWYWFGAPAAFLLSAGVAAGVAGYVGFFMRPTANP